MTRHRLGSAIISKTHFPRLKPAFTLAEVLIVLGIIGLIADMTIPTLIQSTQKKVTSVRLKKFYSSMHQAIRMSEVENGPCLDWDKPTAIRDEEGNLLPDNSPLAVSFFEKYLAKYMIYLTIDKTEELPKVMLNDGSNFQMLNANCLDIIYDTNGTKKPNTEGKDIFRFLLCNRSAPSEYFRKNQCFGPHSAGSVTTRESALQSCKSSPEYCTILLELDNWEFREDYPYKI